MVLDVINFFELLLNCFFFKLFMKNKKRKSQKTFALYKDSYFDFAKN